MALKIILSEMVFKGQAKMKGEGESDSDEDPFADLEDILGNLIIFQ